MSANISATNGVRIFTVVVLSGSLFFLIYHIGRRRLEQQAPKPDSARGTPLTQRYSRGYEGHLKRYFSHHYEKSYPQVSSFSEAVESSKSSATTSHEHPGTSHRYGTDVHDDSPTGSDFSDAEADNPYIFSSTDACRYNLENRAKKQKAQLVTEPEQPFLESLVQVDSQEISSSQVRGTSPGDLSSYEERIKDKRKETQQEDIAGYSTSIRGPRDTFQIAAAEKSGDRRVLPAEHVLTETKREMAPSIYQSRTSYAKPLLYCFMWCILSHSCSLFSRTGMGAKMLTFPAPFFRITVQFIVQTILASCMLRWPMKKVFCTSWTTFLWRVIPVAVAATIDHEPQATIFSNVCENLKVPVVNLLACQLRGPLTNFRKNLGQRTLAAICHVQCKCKAWVPLIAFLLATGYKLDGQGHGVFSNVLIISVGFMLAAYKEHEVESWSLTELLMGSVVSAFRLAATQNLLQNREIGLVSPVVTMRALAPAMALVTAGFSYFIDPWNTLRQTEFFNTSERSLLTWTHITVGALLETSVALAEFVVIYHTSANTMIIVYLLKEMALVTVERFHDHDYTRLNAIGVGVFSVGVASYAWLKYRKTINHVRFQDHPQPISVSGGEGSSSSGGRISFFLTDVFTRTRVRIRTEISSCVDHVLQVNGSLRIICRAWRDRLGLLRSYLRQ